MILAQGRGTPFINISFSGLLWGSVPASPFLLLSSSSPCPHSRYEDEMPCMKLTKSGECYAREAEENAAKAAAEVT